ncbi:MAG: MCE family protein [Chitinivibrionales bacterium]|nr:MCE family protein [Chitinivibrionales bacterium]
MRKTKMDLIVGGSILLSIFILLASVIWLKGYRITSRQVEYTALFPKVGFLQVGDPVSVNGLKMGTVKSIALFKTKVKVVMRIDKSVTITNAALVTVKNVGLMGERAVGIELSEEGKPIPTNKTGTEPVYIQGYFDSGLAEAMGMIGTVLGQVEVLVDNVGVIVDKTVGDSSFYVVFDRLVKRVDTLSLLASEMITENKSDIALAVNNLKLLSNELNVIVNDNRHNIDKLANNAVALTDRGLVLVDEIDSIGTAVGEIVHAIEHGDGTISLMINDDEMYQDIKKSLSSLDTLVNDIKGEGLKLRVTFRKNKDWGD